MHANVRVISSLEHIAHLKERGKETVVLNLPVEFLKLLVRRPWTVIMRIHTHTFIF